MAHVLTCVHGKNEIVLQFLRFQPLSASEGGFVRQKSMRIGVYGSKFENDDLENIEDNSIVSVLNLKKTESKKSRRRRLNVETQMSGVHFVKLIVFFFLDVICFVKIDDKKLKIVIYNITIIKR